MCSGTLSLLSESNQHLLITRVWLELNQQFSSVFPLHHIPKSVSVDNPVKVSCNSLYTKEAQTIVSRCPYYCLTPRMVGTFLSYCHIMWAYAYLGYIVSEILQDYIIVVSLPNI